MQATPPHPQWFFMQQRREVRLATWDEMDLDAGVWTIASRFRGRRLRSCTTYRD